MVVATLVAAIISFYDAENHAILLLKEMVNRLQDQIFCLAFWHLGKPEDVTH